MPVVACVIGEGSSGGALAIGVADRVLMQQNADLHRDLARRAAPRSCGRTPARRERAAAALRPTAEACLALGVVDAIVPEPSGGAHRDHAKAAELLADAIQVELEVLQLDPAARSGGPRGGRKFREHGRVRGVAGPAAGRLPR